MNSYTKLFDRGELASHDNRQNKFYIFVQMFVYELDGLHTQLQPSFMARRKQGKKSTKTVDLGKGKDKKAEPLVPQSAQPETITTASRPEMNGRLVESSLNFAFICLLTA